MSADDEPPVRSPRQEARLSTAWIALAILAGAAAVYLGVRGEVAEPEVAVPSPPGPVTGSAAPAGKPTASASRRGDPTYSNVYQYDYVGPEACRGCHAEQYATWRTHPHARMNDNATATTVVGAFDGRKLRYGDAEVTFAKAAGDYVMDIRRSEEMVRRYRVTRTVGSRFIQMYIGTQLAGPPEEAGNHPQEVKLPFAYWIERDEWFPQTYDETPGTPEWTEEGKLARFYDYTAPHTHAEWSRSCALCHNTYPYAERFGSVGQGKILGFPKEDIQLAVARDEPKDERGAAVLAPWQLVTLGISCESCHFGAREHALENAKISFVPRGEDVVFPKADATLLASARKSPYVINSICAQCHRAGTQGPTYPNGAASWNSGEARDLAAGTCTSQIRCTDCHDPHRAGPVPGGGPDAPEQIAACTRCHEALAEPAAAAEHSRHADGVTCLDCHMPRIVHGLSGVIRSHRISSPSDAAMLAGDFPNACGLCHLERSRDWVVAELARGWEVKVDLGEAQAGGDQPLGERYLAHAEGVVRQVAAEAYARSPEGAAAWSKVLPLLDDPRPPTRMFGRLALEHMLGRRLTHEEYLPWAPPADRKVQVEGLRALAPPALHD